MTENVEDIDTLYIKAMGLPKEDPQREALLLKALESRMMASIKDASDFSPNGTPLILFCYDNAISPRLGQRVIDELLDYVHSPRPVHHKITKKAGGLNLGEDENVYFTPSEAVKIVVEAFKAFDPEMAMMVSEAFEEGRISFAPSIYGAQSAASGYTATVPKDIEALSERLRNRPYASVPLNDGINKVSLQNLFFLAHECGHLCAFQKYANALRSAPEQKLPLSNTPLQETFSALAERLLYRHLSTTFSKNDLLAYNINTVWKNRLDGLFFTCAKRAEMEAALVQEYKKTSVDGRLPDVARIDAITKEIMTDVPTSPWQNEILIRYAPFRHIAYPLGAAASQILFNRWMAGNNVTKKNLASDWSRIQEKCQETNFMSAMREMKIEPDKDDFLQHAIDGYEIHEMALESALDLVYASRTRAGLINRNVNSILEKGSKQPLALAANSSQLGCLAYDGRQLSQPAIRRK